MKRPQQNTAGECVAHGFLFSMLTALSLCEYLISHRLSGVKACGGAERRTDSFMQQHGFREDQRCSQ